MFPFVEIVHFSRFSLSHNLFLFTQTRWLFEIFVQKRILVNVGNLTFGLYYELERSFVAATLWVIRVTTSSSLSPSSLIVRRRPKWVIRIVHYAEFTVSFLHRVLSRRECLSVLRFGTASSRIFNPRGTGRAIVIPDARGPWRRFPNSESSTKVRFGLNFPNFLVWNNPAARVIVCSALKEIVRPFARRDWNVITGLKRRIDCFVIKPLKTKSRRHSVHNEISYVNFLRNFQRNIAILFLTVLFHVLHDLTSFRDISPGTFNHSAVRKVCLFDYSGIRNQARIPLQFTFSIFFFRRYSLWEVRILRRCYE